MKKEFNLYTLTDKNYDHIFASAVYHKKGYKYATNAFILCRIKAQYDEKLEGRLLLKDDSMLPEDTYVPNMDCVIPCVNKKFVSVKVDFAKIKTWHALAKAHKQKYKKEAHIYVEIPGTNTTLEYNFFVKYCKALRSLGMSEIMVHPTISARPIVAQADSVTLIMMPGIARKAYDDTENYKWFTL